MKATLKWMDPQTGHTEMTYDTEVHKEVLKAERRFNELLREHSTVGQTIGRRAYSVTHERGRRVAEPIKDFDTEAEEILLISPMMGG